MAIADPNRLGKVTDLSEEINIIPNQWGVINSIGLFQNKPKTQKSVLIPRTIREVALLEDRNWDERNQTIKGGKRDMLPVAIPHFPVDEAITPNDLDGNIDFSSLLSGGNNVLTLDKVRAEKMEAIRQSLAITLEYSRAQMLQDCTAYAPNGTVLLDLYNEYGGTRKHVYFDLESVDKAPVDKPEEAIAHIQDNIGDGSVVEGFLALCSPEFFNALTTNDYIYESYLYFSQQQSAILNGRLTGAVSGFDNRFRSFSYGGIDFLEVRGTVGGKRYVKEGEAYVVPTNTNLFQTYYAPADRLSTINKPALESYYFEYLNEKDDFIEIMAESNFLNFVANPQVIVTLDIGKEEDNQDED